MNQMGESDTRALLGFVFDGHHLVVVSMSTGCQLVHLSAGIILISAVNSQREGTLFDVDFVILFPPVCATHELYREAPYVWV